MEKIFLAFVFILVSGALDYGLYYYLSGISHPLCVVILILLSIGEIWGLLEILFK
jgi:hypothetical protein